MAVSLGCREGLPRAPCRPHCRRLPTRRPPLPPSRRLRWQLSQQIPQQVCFLLFHFIYLLLSFIFDVPFVCEFSANAWRSIYVLDIVDLENFHWTKPVVKGTPPCPRSGHTCTAIPNTTKILVFGGFDGKKCFNDVCIHMNF